MKYVSQIHWRHPVGYNEKIQIFKITREAENLWPYVDKTDATIHKPKNLSKMLQIASKLSAKFKQVRVDLYNIKGKIYFGELTFTPGNGAIKFEPPTWDLVFGKLWV